MNETTFENAQVNDKVYDILRGWGTVIRKTLSHNTIEVSFPNHSRGTYFKDGKADRRENRRLYWEQPEIHADPRPARDIQKTAASSTMTLNAKFFPLIYGKVIEGEIKRGSRGIMKIKIFRPHKLRFSILLE